MIRSALAVALVSLACLFSVAEDVVFRMETPQPGRRAPFTVRADRRLSLTPESSARYAWEVVVDPAAAAAEEPPEVSFVRSSGTARFTFMARDR